MVYRDSVRESTKEYTYSTEAGASFISFFAKKSAGRAF